MKVATPDVNLKGKKLDYFWPGLLNQSQMRNHSWTAEYAQAQGYKLECSVDFTDEQRFNLDWRYGRIEELRQWNTVSSQYSKTQEKTWNEQEKILAHERASQVD